MNTHNNNEISTSDSGESIVEMVVVKSYKPKDPLYFQKYYQEKLKGVTLFCQACNKYISKPKRARHAQTKKHIKNDKERERQIEREANYIYSEFD